MVEQAWRGLVQEEEHGEQWSGARGGAVDWRKKLLPPALRGKWDMGGKAAEQPIEVALCSAPSRQQELTGGGDRVNLRSTLKAEGNSKGFHALLTFLLGGLSGMTTSAILQPLDVVKTHMQAGEGERRAGAGLGAGTSNSQAPQTVRRVVSTIYKKEGVLGFWRGLGPTCLRVGLGAGLYFALLDHMLAGLRVIYTPVEPMLSGGPADQGIVFNQQQPKEAVIDGKVPPGLYAAAGVITRSVAATLLCPMTVIKTRMEYAAVTGQVYRNTFHALTTIGKVEGLRGLYSGLLPTLVRDAPYSGLYLLTYNQIKESSRAFLPGKDIPQAYINFLAGAIAGGSSTLLTHPPDVVRTRLQLQMDSSRGAMLLARSMLAKEGVGSFFSGVSPRVTKRALQMAFSWTIYEELLLRILNRNMWGATNAAG